MSRSFKCHAWVGLRHRSPRSLVGWVESTKPNITIPIDHLIHLQLFAKYQQSQRNFIKLHTDRACHREISKVLQTKKNKYCKVLPINPASLIIKVDRISDKFIPIAEHLNSIPNLPVYQESKVMSISQIFDNMTRYFSEAMARIFGPNDDAYPEIGVQPFNGEPYQDNGQAD